MKIKFLSCIIILLTISNNKIFPQPDFSVSYTGYYDDNIFNNYENTTDYVNSFSFETAYNYETELNNVQIYYDGNLSSFQKLKLKNSDSHKIGFVNTYLFENKNPLNAGINFSLRNNRDEFNVYDFSQLSGYLNYRHEISENNYLSGGYLFKRNNFKNFALFSHYEHISFIRWISEYLTGTSLNIGLEFNYKQYFESYDISGYADYSSQAKLKSGLYQVLSEHTGLQLDFEYRINLTDESRYLMNDEYIYYEEEIFNDLYSNEGYSAGIELTQLLTDEIMAGLEFKYISRNYSSLTAADLAGNSKNILRKDDLFLGGVMLNYDLEELFNGFSFELRWNYLRNQSNDLYYDYNNNLISFSLVYIN